MKRVQAASGLIRLAISLFFVILALLRSSEAAAWRDVGMKIFFVASRVAPDMVTVQNIEGYSGSIEFDRQDKAIKDVRELLEYSKSQAQLEKTKLRLKVVIFEEDREVTYYIDRAGTVRIWETGDTYSLGKERMNGLQKMILRFRGYYSAAEASSAIDPGMIVTLRRTSCLGPCPAYKLTVFTDGTVIFFGIKHVRALGTVHGKIADELLDQLVSEFEKAKYYALRDSYRTAEDGCSRVWTDHPEVTTSFQFNQRYKSVVHYHGCEVPDDQHLKRLTDLENRIDEIVGTKQWIE